MRLHTPNEGVQILHLVFLLKHQHRIYFVNYRIFHPVVLCNLLYSFAINATSIYSGNTQYTTCFDWYWSSSGVCSHTQLSNCNPTFTFLYHLNSYIHDFVDSCLSHYMT
jgi:hypothetical protein